MKLILSPSPEPMALVSPDKASGYFFLTDLTFHLRYKDKDAFLEAIFRQKANKEIETMEVIDLESGGKRKKVKK